MSRWALRIRLVVSMVVAMFGTLVSTYAQEQSDRPAVPAATRMPPAVAEFVGQHCIEYHNGQDDRRDSSRNAGRGCNAAETNVAPETSRIPEELNDYRNR